MTLIFAVVLQRFEQELGAWLNEILFEENVHDLRQVRHWFFVLNERLPEGENE